MTPLKDTWLKLSGKLDAMTLRERALVFVTATAMILFLLYTMAVEPMLSRQTALLAQISQQQNQVSGIDVEIAALARGFVSDPDAVARDQLNQASAGIDSAGAKLLAIQKGLVAPEKIAPLLEHLLRGNGKLSLLSLRTLPVTGMNEAAAAPAAPSDPAPATAGLATGGAAPELPKEQALLKTALQNIAPAAPGSAPAAAPVAVPAATAGAASPATAQPAPEAAASAKPRELLYRHGVEIVLQGSYLDMINYMQALEALPVQLFWGGVRLDVQQYPDARLTLTLYTLSLDEQWIKL